MSGCCMVLLFLQHGVQTRGERGLHRLIQPAAVPDGGGPALPRGALWVWGCRTVMLSLQQWAVLCWLLSASQQSACNRCVESGWRLHSYSGT